MNIQNSLNFLRLSLVCQVGYFQQPLCNHHLCRDVSNCIQDKYVVLPFTVNCLLKKVTSEMYLHMKLLVK